MTLRRFPALSHRATLRELLLGLGAYGSAEFATRVVRLVVTLVIARQLAPAMVGQAALALSLFEMVRVLERAGAGQRLVTVAADQLAATCNTVARLYWAWTVVLVVLQLVVAAALAAHASQASAGLMLAVLALVYPCMAAGCVSYHLAVRERRVPALARISATQAITDQVLTLVLMLTIPGPWAIVLPKLLTAPVWLVMTRRARPWQADRTAGFAPMRHVLRFALPVLAADILGTVRTQGDNLIIAATLGSTALGTYYFAFNAGLGIASSVVSAFAAVVFPMFAAETAGAARIAVLRRVALVGVALVMAQVGAQAIAAPWYVPLVFGQRWAFAAPLIAVLCLGGLPLLLAALTSAWLRADHRPGTDAAMSALGCGLALGGLWLGTLSGSLWIAAGALIAGQLLGALIAAWRVLAPVLFAGTRLARPLSPFAPQIGAVQETLA